MTNAEIQNHLDRYLELRRALGFEMRNEGRLLQDFLTFLQVRTLGEPLIAQAAIDWACSRGGSKWQSGRLSIARCFLVHLRAHHPGVEVPPPGIISAGGIVAASYLRHIDRAAGKLWSPPRRSRALARCRCRNGF